MMQQKNLDLHLKIEYNRLSEVCQQWKITELALFGSVLRDDFNFQSDVDVLVSFANQTKITFFDLDTIEEELSKLFARPVDLVTKRAVEQSHNWIRKKNILDNSLVIYLKCKKRTPVIAKLNGEMNFCSKDKTAKHP